LDGGLELLQIAHEQAKAGKTPMLKFFLERIVPKDRLVHLELPTMERWKGHPMLITCWRR
jgi:hypothetical protein